MTLVDEAVLSGARQSKACHALEISVRTYQRWCRDEKVKEDGRPGAVRPTPSHALSDEERQRVLFTLNQGEFASMPPSQVVPRLADEGVYLCSESSMYRILREAKQQHHRGRSQAPEKRPLATHKAMSPNEVWCWDITWLPGPAKGIHYYLYLMLDLFSRKVVGWEIHESESADNASRLLRKACMKERISTKRNPLVLHSDNGSPMKGSSMLETMYHLGVVSSFSRPRVSNDNAYAESIFRTCKYRPDYPYKGFKSIDEAQQWVLNFVTWYNTEHRHSGIKFVTPNERHRGQDVDVLVKRKAVYEKAKKQHPKRWSGNVRNWNRIDQVWLNPERDDVKLNKVV
ncbi:MAG: IS3 family transposase [Pseudomonadales bacterium]|nr:IS3 family transposase [Pseudomonadales bacterium]